MKRLVLALLCLAAIPVLSRAEMLIHDGDRVVFVGDSITEFGNYTNPVETYFSLRYPGMKVDWFNAGWAGDRTDAALYRLERDVLALKPTVVTLCFGMNDAYYMKPEASIGDLYATNLSSLIKRLKAAGIRVAVLTPGVVDEEGEKNRWMKDIDYNRGGLDMVRGRTLKVAGQEGVPAQDIHTLFTKVLAAAKRADKNFQFAPDGIHPDEGGGLVMSYALLKA
ncbi:MAG: SGNH/GDSL hydrolase family protein, partial [candidate division FCPU426 bacterium]